MNFLAKLKISQKLPLVIVSGVVVVGLAIGTAAVLVGSSVITQIEFEKLDSSAAGHVHELKTFIHDIEIDLTLSANNPFTIEALNAFNAGWTELKGDRTKVLQDAYIDDNPNPLGQKHLFNAADGGTSYDSSHAQYHPIFRTHLEAHGYYDLFLFNDKGDLIYSVFKETDFATNFARGKGPWADTDLGNAFRAGISLNKREVAFFDFRPYGPSADAPASFMSTPVFEGEKRIGVMVFQMPVHLINEIMQSNKGLGESGETILLGADHLMRSDSKYTEVDDVLVDRFDATNIDAVFNGQVVTGEVHWHGYTKLFAAEPLEIAGTKFAVIGFQNKAEALKGIDFLRNLMLAIGALLTAVIGFVGFMFSKTITRPISSITNTMRALADNDLDIEVVGLEREDEIGSMARRVEIFRDNAVKVAELGVEEAARQKAIAERTALMEELQQSFGVVVGAAAAGDFSQRVNEDLPDDELVKISRSVNTLVETVQRGISETGAVLAALANTDLTKRMEGHYEGSFAELKNDTNRVADRLSEVVGQLRTTSGALKNATGEILEGANDLSERTTRQAATIEETSAAMESLSETVLENAKEAESASAIADKVRATAENGGEVMAKANTAMERITESSGKISNIIGMIDDIAFQTNLLALNASVEAARAGEAGKGFAVVAVEVRRLAQSAAEASNDVKALVEQSVSEVGTGSQLVAEAATSLSSMLEAARENNAIMVSIADKSKAQASAIEQINTAVRDMDETTQHNAALVEETNAAIEQTESQALELDRIVDIFKTDTSAVATNAAKAATPQPKPQDVKSLQKRVNGFATQGSSALAVEDDWQEF